MLQPDTLLQGRYRIIRQLKQGGMGTVYEALDERLDSPVALKECHFEDESLRRQFEREARLLARLRHPAMTKVIDHFTEGDGQFLVMEFIPGVDLSEMILARTTPFPQAEVLTWADQLLDALDYLHTQQPPIIHRDIKPQNLKLTARGQIILLDFGLAKGYVGRISRITTTGSIFGYTPTYAPLEQIQGAGTDERSDLYSLAATIYHLLTLTPPPDALTRITDVTNEQPDPLRPISAINPEVSHAVSEVIRRAMSQNRERRPRNASEMRALLREAERAAPPATSDTVVDMTTQDASSRAAAAPLPPSTSPEGETTAPPPAADAAAGPRPRTAPPTPSPPASASQPRVKERGAATAPPATPAVTARFDRPALEGGERRRGNPDFPSFTASSPAPGIRWWWVALPALVLLTLGSSLLYVTRGLYTAREGVGPAANNLALNATNDNQAAAVETASPTPSTNSRLTASPSPAQPSQAATPSPTPAQRSDAKTNANALPVASGSPADANGGEPPSAPRPTPSRNAIVSGGILNGKAISKPQPVYPPIAKAARASGTVTVQILVDEEGRVVSATAVSGHPLLQAAAVAAARQARFTPTLMAGQPVKVSGVITYNFVLQ